METELYKYVSKVTYFTSLRYFNATVALSSPSRIPTPCADCGRLRREYVVDSQWKEKRNSPCKGHWNSKIFCYDCQIILLKKHAWKSQMVLGLFTDLIVYHLGYFRYVPKVAGSHCGQVQYISWTGGCPIKMTQFIVHQLTHYIVRQLTHYKFIVHQLMHYKVGAL